MFKPDLCFCSQRPRSPLNNQHGFSLIEVVIALGILAFGILTMFSLQLFAIKGNSSALKVTQEATSRADGLDMATSYDFDAITEAQSQISDFHPTGGTEKYLVAIQTISKNDPLPGMATVAIKLTARNGEEVTYNYVKADPKAF